MPAIRAFAAAVVAGCAACSPPPKPPTDRPPEPQATQLRDVIRAPIDKAKAVEGRVQDVAEAQRKAVEAAGG